MPRKTNDAGIALIKSFEGLHDGDSRTPTLEPEMCPRGIWTVGWGHAIFVGGRPLIGEATKDAAMKWYFQRYPSGMTKADADVLFIMDLAERENAVEKMITVPVTDNQFAALISFAYNLGLKALSESTLLRRLNAKDYAGASNEFRKWVNSGAQKALPGLVRRRAAERELFLKGG